MSEPLGNATSGLRNFCNHPIRCGILALSIPLAIDLILFFALWEAGKLPNLPRERLHLPAPGWSVVVTVGVLVPLLGAAAYLTLKKRPALPVKIQLPPPQEIPQTPGDEEVTSDEDDMISACANSEQLDNLDVDSDDADTFFVDANETQPAPPEPPPPPAPSFAETIRTQMRQFGYNLNQKTIDLLARTVEIAYPLGLKRTHLSDLEDKERTALVDRTRVKCAVLASEELASSCPLPLLDLPNDLSPEDFQPRLDHFQQESLRVLDRMIVQSQTGTASPIPTSFIEKNAPLTALLSSYLNQPPLGLLWKNAYQLGASTETGLKKVMTKFLAKRIEEEGPSSRIGGYLTILSRDPYLLPVIHALNYLFSKETHMFEDDVCKKHFRSNLPGLAKALQACRDRLASATDLTSMCTELENAYQAFNDYFILALRLRLHEVAR